MKTARDVWNDAVDKCRTTNEPEHSRYIPCSNCVKSEIDSAMVEIYAKGRRDGLEEAACYTEQQYTITRGKSAFATAAKNIAHRIRNLANGVGK